MLSTGNKDHVSPDFIKIWLETFTNCNFNEFFSFVKFVKITSTWKFAVLQYFICSVVSEQETFLKKGMLGPAKPVKN